MTGTIRDVAPLVPQPDGGDDWAGETSWGHTLAVRARIDEVSIWDGFAGDVVTLSPKEARRLARLLQRAARIAQA